MGRPYEWLPTPMDDRLTCLIYVCDFIKRCGRLQILQAQPIVHFLDMAQVDQATVERIIEEITHQVLVRLNSLESQADDCCADGSCTNCNEKTNQAVKAGADRISSTLGRQLPADAVGRMIDHTLLKPDASRDQIAQLCYEARKFHFASVCVNPTNVKLAAQLLDGSDVAVCTVVGFPLGATPGDGQSV